jgi:hypothetical protein
VQVVAIIIACQIRQASFISNFFFFVIKVVFLITPIKDCGGGGGKKCVRAKYIFKCRIFINDDHDDFRTSLASTMECK